MKKDSFSFLQLQWPSIELLIAAIPVVTAFFCLAGDLRSVSVIRILVFTLFISSIFLVFHRTRRRRIIATPASTAMIVAFIFWYSYPAIINYFIPTASLDPDIYPYVSDELLIKSIALLALYQVFLIIGSSLRIGGHRTYKAKHPFRPSYAIFKLKRFWISIVACIGGVLPYVLSGFSFTDIRAAVIESRAVDKPWVQIENLGSLTSPFTFAATSALIAGAISLWLIVVDRTAKRSFRICSFVVAISVTTVLYFDQGTRANTVMIVAPAALILLTELWRKSKIAVVGSAIAIILIGIVLLQYQTLYRTAYTRDTIKEGLLREWHTLGRTIDYFSENTFAVAIVPSLHDYFKESNFIQFITSPVPRFLWPNKPVSEVVRFYTLSRWNVDIMEGAGNTFPGLVGQYYMSWGWAGAIIIGILFGLLAGHIDRKTAPKLMTRDLYSAASGVLIITWMFLCYRVLSPAYLYPIAIFSLIGIMSRKEKARTIRLNGAGLVQSKSKNASK